MSIKVKAKFTLKRTGLEFTDRQKMYIDYHVNMKKTGRTSKTYWI